MTGLRDTGKSALPTLLAPPEQLIVVPLKDGKAERANIHLPSASRERPGPGKTVVVEWLTDRLARNGGVPPYEWPAMCGPVGVVYAKGGPFESAPVCGACVSVEVATARQAARRAA